MHQRTHNEAEPRPPHQKLQSLKIINFYCNILQFDILRPKNNNLVVLPEYLFRKTKKKGRFFEAAAGGGWMYQKPDRMIILYDNGSFTETNRGWSYIAPTILLGGGKKIQKGALKETAFSVGLRWFGQYPFNGFLMHHFALEGRVAIPGYLFNKQ